MPSINTVISCFCVITFAISTVTAIKCYQCSGTDSNNPFECNEYLDNDADIQSTECSNIHDAKYCIKHIGRIEVEAIDCYQCNTSDTMECGDGLMKLDGGVLKPSSCEHVHKAQFCVKHTGGVGTQRFCSALDLGNYCNYVQQPGDKLEYRTCIFTCGTDGCNGAANYRISAILLTGIVGYFFIFKI